MKIFLKYFQELQEQAKAKEEATVLGETSMVQTEQAKRASEILSSASVDISLEEMRALQKQSRETEENKFNFIGNGPDRVPTLAAKNAKAILDMAKVNITLAEMEQLEAKSRETMPSPFQFLDSNSSVVPTQEASEAKVILEQAAINITLKEMQELQERAKEKMANPFMLFDSPSEVPTVAADRAKAILDRAKVNITLAEMKQLQEQAKETYPNPFKIFENDSAELPTPAAQKAKELLESAILVVNPSELEALEAQSNETRTFNGLDGAVMTVPTAAATEAKNLLKNVRVVEQTERTMNEPQATVEEQVAPEPKPVVPDQVQAVEEPAELQEDPELRDQFIEEVVSSLKKGAEEQVAPEPEPVVPDQVQAVEEPAELQEDPELRDQFIGEVVSSLRKGAEEQATVETKVDEPELAGIPPLEAVLEDTEPAREATPPPEVDLDDSALQAQLVQEILASMTREPDEPQVDAGVKPYTVSQVAPQVEANESRVHHYVEETTPKRHVIDYKKISKDVRTAKQKSEDAMKSSVADQIKIIRARVNASIANLVTARRNGLIGTRIGPAVQQEVNKANNQIDMAFTTLQSKIIRIGTANRDPMAEVVIAGVEAVKKGVEDSSRMSVADKSEHIGKSFKKTKANLDEKSQEAKGSSSRSPKAEAQIQAEFGSAVQMVQEAISRFINVVGSVNLNLRRDEYGNVMREVGAIMRRGIQPTTDIYMGSMKKMSETLVQQVEDFEHEVERSQNLTLDEGRRTVLFSTTDVGRGTLDQQKDTTGKRVEERSTQENIQQARNNVLRTDYLI